MRPAPWVAGRPLRLAWYFLAQVLFLVCASDAFLVRVDDTFYYFGVARHVVDSGRFTFDGINPTNGFQPLWEFTLIAITRVLRVFGVSDTLSRMHAYFAACAALNTLAAWLALALMDRQFGKRTKAAQLAALPFLWIPGLTASLLGGMEACVNWPLLLLLFYLLSQGDVSLGDMSRRRLLAVTCVSILLVHARLDNAVILATIVLFLWLRERSLAAVKNGLIWGASTALSWVPLLYWGYAKFSSPTPVSGAVKMLHTAQFISKHGLIAYLADVVRAFVASVLALPVAAVGMGYYELLKPLVLRLGFTSVVCSLGVALLGVGLLALKLLRHRQLTKRPAAPSTLHILAAASAVHLPLITALFPDQWMYAGLLWYFLVEYLFLFMLVGWIGGWLASGIADAWWRRLQPLAQAVTVLAVVPMLLWRPDRPTEGQLKVAAAQWINEQLPASAVVASHDAGILGYFSRVPVVNIDGLVNSREYLDAYLRPRRKKDYLKDAGITHLADVDCPKTPTARFSGLVRLPSEGRIVMSIKGNEHDLDFCIVELVP